MKKISYFIIFLVILAVSCLKLTDLNPKLLPLLDGEQERMIYKNKDVYAQIKVAGTNIDYPIVQHPSDDSYYLRHDVNQSETIYGAIFTEKMNRKDFKDLVTIVYGHSTNDGSMFGSLERFADSAFFQKNKRIEIDSNSKDETITYDIFSAYSYTDDHLFQTFDLGNPLAVPNYFETIKQISENLTGNYRDIGYTPTDRLQILSTCDTKDNGRRFIVHAKETNRIKVNQDTRTH